MASARPWSRHTGYDDDLGRVDVDRHAVADPRHVDADGDRLEPAAVVAPKAQPHDCAVTIGRDHPGTVPRPDTDGLGSCHRRPIAVHVDVRHAEEGATQSSAGRDHSRRRGDLGQAARAE